MPVAACHDTIAGEQAWCRLDGIQAQLRRGMDERTGVLESARASLSESQVLRAKALVDLFYYLPICFGPEGNSNLVGSYRNNRATATTGRRLGEVIGVPRLTRPARIPTRVAVGRAMISRLGHRSMSQQDTTGCADSPHDRRFGDELPAQEYQRTLAGVVLVIRVYVVFGKEGDSMHRATDLAGCPLLVHGCGDCESIGIDLADRMEISTWLEG